MAIGEVITIKLRLDWQDRICFDRTVSHVDFRVAFAIAWHINRRSGKTHVGRNTIAEKVGVHVRTVDHCIQRLEERGYLHVERSRGRSRSNNYRLVFPEKAAVAPPFHVSNLSEKAANEPPFINEEKAADDTEKGGAACSKRRPVHRPNPFYNPVTNPSGDQGRRTFASRGAYEQRLAQLIGPTEAKGWETLLAVDEQLVATLCRKLRNGALEATDLEDVRARHLEARCA